MQHGFCRLRPKDEDQNFFYIQDPRFGTKIRRAKVFASSIFPIPNVTPITYYCNQSSYTFVFRLQGRSWHWIFVKLSNDELIDNLATTGAIIAEKTPVFWLNSSTTVIETSIMEM